MGLSRGGIGTKLHLAHDAGGLPLGFVLTRGNRHEGPIFPEVMAQARQARPRQGLPAKLAADKGYSAPQIRAWLKKRRIQDVIPTRQDEDALGRRDPDFDRPAYRGRNVVERCVGRLKECRRLATRYEKLAVNFAAMIPPTSGL